MAINAYQATTTLATTGTAVVVATPGFLGKEVEIKASGKNGGDSTVRLSLGWGDGTRQSCDSSFYDGTLIDSRKQTDRIVSIWGNDGAGNLVELVKASNPTFTATQLKLDVTTVDTNYKISVKITG
jgi:hypothetical protein